MAYEHKDESGSLFYNQNRQHDRQPVWKGSAKIKGEEFYIAAWENAGRDGVYLSLKFESKADADARRGVSQSHQQDRRENPPSRSARSQELIDQTRTRMQQMGQQNRQQSRPTPAPLDDYADDEIPF